LSVKLLKERGVTVNPEDIKQERAEALENSSRPTSIDKTALIFLYIIALFSGFIPILAGIVFITTKKPNSAGVRVPKYDIPSRKHGRNLVLLGCISTMVLLYFFSS
jgi:hypothetical protein